MLKKLNLFIFIIFPVISLAQNHRIYGYILQKDSKETLIAAHVFDDTNQKHTVTNQSGFYSLLLPEGKSTLKISYLGYADQQITFNLLHDTLVNIYLEPQNQNIGEVVIHGEKPIHEQTLMGKITLTAEKIKQIPSFVGLPDLMKAVTTIPGVSMGREGRSSIYVRGGDRGQNLILLDGAKLYNTNHLGGFVSLFNSSIIKQVDVYKGGFPANYGGRASSVIDITTRDGNREKTQGQFDLGVLNSGITVEGPIKKKISYIAAIRSTYFDLFTINAKGKLNTTGEGNYFGYTFYDANAKISYFPSPYHKLFINFYSGADFNRNLFKQQTSTKDIEDQTAYTIDNRCITIGDYLLITPQLTWKNTVTHSKYSNNLETNSYLKIGQITNNEVFNSSTSIMEYNLQSRMQYFASNNNNIKSGIQYSNYQFVPGREYSSQTNDGTGYRLDTIQGYTSSIFANELAAYIEDEMQIVNNLFLNIGFREVIFNCNKESYFKTEPRVSLRSMLGKNFSFKANYTIMNQFNHVLVSNYYIFEKETWITSNENIPPEKAQQFSGGFFATLPKLNLEMSAEGYYKSMTDLLEYQAPSTGIATITNLENMIEKGGTGKAYGMELQLKYKAERFSIDAGYVLAWNYRQFQQLNEGKPYPFLYDRRHQFSLLSSVVLGKHYSLNSNFIFATGSPFSLPDAYIKSKGMSYNYYAFSGINNYRMPNYHRLDLALIKREATRKGNIQQFSLNIYNAYARKNPAAVYFDASNGKLYQKSLFTIVPTISYALEF